MSYQNKTGKFVALSENIDGKQIWYNVKDGDIVDPKTPHGVLAAIKHGLTATTNTPISAVKLVSKPVTKPKKK